MNIIAVDVGYNATKVVRPTTGARAIFPSVVGTPARVRDYGHTLTSLGSHLVLVKGNHNVPVGDTAFSISKMTAARRDPSWILSEEWQTLFTAALSSVVESRYLNCNVVVGLPIQDWGVYAPLLAGMLKRSKFEFCRMGKDSQTIEISEVSVLTQPYGSLLNQALDVQGQYIEGTVWGGLVGVVDLGGNTINLLATDGLVEIDRLTTSDEFGLLHMLDYAAADMRQKFPRLNLSTHEIAQWIALGSFPYQGEQIPILPYVQSYLDDLLDITAARIDSAWPTISRFDAILITGGGASAIGKILAKRLSHQNVVVADNPQWGNVTGYGKYGMRLWGGGYPHTPEDAEETTAERQS